MKISRLAKRFRLVLAMIAVCIFVDAAASQSMFRKVNDFDGDGRADFVITRRQGGLLVWYIWQSTDGFRGLQWGLASDLEATGDFDGDGRTDIAVGRDNNDLPLHRIDYYVLRSQSNTPTVITMNASNASQSNPQDYDGDGKSDPAVVMNAAGSSFTFYRSSMTNGINTSQMPSGTVVRIGDLSGDGKAEPAVYQPSLGTGKLFVRDPSGPITEINFGLAGDEFVLADFNGDNKGEIAIFRPTTGDWWWIDSADGTLKAARWGISGDIPVPADYDGDGKTDIAIYRQSAPNGVYWVNGSAGSAFAVAWGIAGDTPIRY